MTKKMAFDDLDLEFEDEDEQNKKKKSEAIQVDGDLEFHTPEGAKPKAVPPQRPQGAGTAPGIQRPAPGKPAEVRKIDEARAAQAQARPQQAAPAPRPAAVPQSQPRVVGSSALKEDGAYDLESQHVVEMREQMRKVQLEAEVKVQVAEFKTEYLTEMLSDMKLASHQIEQLLVRINAKHPDMKNEVLMIKKILADFTAKKRK